MTEQELAGMIWNVKETIRDTYDDTEVILMESVVVRVTKQQVCFGISKHSFDIQD